LDTRLSDIERITKNLKESAASLFAEMRRDDIKGAAEEMLQLVLAEEFELALNLLDDLEEQYFQQEHAEPGLIRATSRIWEVRGMLRNLPAESVAKQAMVDQLMDTLIKIKEDAQHPSKYRLNITNEHGRERAYYIEPGSSVQGLLNIGRRNPRQTIVLVDGRVIPREEYRNTLLSDDSEVELRFDQAMIVIEKERLQAAIGAARTFVQEVAQRQGDSMNVHILLNNQTLGRWPLAASEEQILTFVEGKLRRENPRNAPGGVSINTLDNRVYISFRPSVTPDFPVDQPDFPNDAAMLSLADRAELLAGIFAMKQALNITDAGIDPQLLVSGEFLNTQGNAVTAVALSLWETDQPATVNPQRLELIRKVQEYLADQLGVESLYRITDKDQQPQADTPYQYLFGAPAFSGLYLGIPEEVVGEEELVLTVIREAEDVLETLIASISNNIRLEQRGVPAQGDQAVLAETQ
ncbi:MAG: hypothetical protein K8I00_01945, partial [Candidatus Omnitrophica bacterium]|nr:hypothetical protein [Candidatus Omnitrophota bacterium]